MKALVTGASGFVGRYLVKHLLESGDSVIAAAFPEVPADAFPDHPDLQRAVLDITDREACARLIESARPDGVYHLAGISFVPEAEEDFARALAINVAGFDNVARACARIGSGTRLLLVSSGEVYGKVPAAELPITEETPVRPANCYSLTKYMAEIVAERCKRMGLPHVVIARPFNHIGPGQDPRFVAPSFAAQLAQISVGLRDRKLRAGNLDVRRDFSDVRDMVRAYRLALQKGTGIYNLGAGRSTSIREILDRLIRISGVDVEVQTDAALFRPGETMEIYSSIERAKKDLGWSPSIPLDDTLAFLYQSSKNSVLPRP